MTVCIATTDYLPQQGGIVTFTRHLSTLLVGAGHKVIILTIAESENISEVQNENDKIAVVRISNLFNDQYKKHSPYYKAGGIDTGRWVSAGFAMQEWLLINCNKFNIDVIEVSDYGGLGIFLCHEKLPPVIITAHGSFTQCSRYSDEPNKNDEKIVKELELLSFKNADAIIAHNPRNKKELEELTMRNVFQALIPFVSTYKPAPAKENGYALVAAGLHPYKGPEVLANAIVTLKDKDIAVKWVGVDSYSNSTGQSMAAKLKEHFPSVWGKSFNWFNSLPHSNTQELIEGCEMMIIPSIWETFNYTILEAASNCKPLIISTGAGASYLFEDENNALLISPRDTEALASAIQKLHGDQSLRQKLGNNAALLISKIFNPVAIIKNRIKIYESAIKNQTNRNKNILEDFLRTYETTYRKVYFTLRKIAKIIFRPSK